MVEGGCNCEGRRKEARKNVRNQDTQDILGRREEHVGKRKANIDGKWKIFLKTLKFTKNNVDQLRIRSAFAEKQVKSNENSLLLAHQAIYFYLDSDYSKE